MTLRSVIYARQSLDRSGEGAAVDRQIADCRALAEARGWDVVEVLTDNDVSASSSKVRPGYQRVLQLVEGGGTDRVVVWAVDRLTRKMRDLEDVVDLCERTGVAVATVSGDLDLSTDMGRLVARILGSVARGETERKGTRQKRANLQRAQAGNVGWTRRPFGYDRADGHVFIVEDEATAIQMACREVIKGASLASLARDITGKGLLTTAGKPWNVTTLRRVLLNPRYAGRAVYKGEDHGEGTWPAILTSEAQERLEGILRNPKRRTHNGTETKYLLSGLVVCGVCGDRMYASPVGPSAARYMAYRCRPPHLTRRLDLVDEVVVGVILERLSRPDALDLFAPDVDLDRLRSEAVDLRNRRDDLADLLSEGLLSAAKVREQTRKLSEHLREIETVINAAEQADPVSDLAGSVDVRATWEGLSMTSRRAVIDALVSVSILPAGKGIRWSPDQVRIEWRTS